MSTSFNRYSKWDGTQQINPITPDEIMRALSDDLLNEGDLNLAMQRLFRFGFQGENGERFSGLREMLERVRQKQMEQLQRYDLGSIMEQIQQKLGEIVQTEREAIDKRVADSRQRSDGVAIGDKSDAERESDSGSDTNNDDLQRLLEQITDRKRAQLDALPDDPAGQIKGLQEYEFMSQKAAEEFRQLLDQLQQQVMQQTFEGVQQSLSNMSPEDLADMRQMMSELNDMIERRSRGEDPGFNEFMHRWGHYFGSDINDLDELLERMKQRMGAMQQLMNSMTPEQREQLMGSMQAAMQDPGLQEQMSRLNQNLGLMQNPGQGQDWRQGYQFSGSEQLSLAEAMRMLDNINDIDKLEQDLRDVRDWRDLDALLDDRFKEILGDEAAEQLDQLSKMAATLEEAGLIKKNRRGYELTPQGVRKIGEKALEDIFLHLKHDKSGQHELNSVGTAGERIDVTKPYEFGDPFLLDLPKTVMNAVRRQGAGSPVRLHPDDFEVYKTEHVTRSSTVIMVDMSRSMFYNGCFAAARKVTLALESLIRSRFPKDDLSILGFSYIAEPLKAIDLPTLEWNEYQYGTNMQHGFQLARQILARQKGTNKQIILITDGEPTAHIENGQVQFQYPPTPRTFEMTLKEVIRCTRDGITINTFMLEQTPYLINFVNDLMQINKGRVFLSTADRLGEYVLVDYVAHKQKWIG
ncbi:VWA domain-containing protein [soil metagenome]